MIESSTRPFLSIVIPAYNEEHRLPPTLNRIWEYLCARPFRSEIVVVDDGSQDATCEIVRQFGLHHPVQLVCSGHQGKGGAVRMGMLEAAGEFILTTDADLATPIEDLDLLLAAIEEGCDVAIGSRAMPGSVLEVRQPRYRELMGRTGNLLIQTILLPGLHDTQCGFKLFRNGAAREVFSRSVMDGVSFDIEVLYLARKLGYRIKEVPVHRSHREGSKIHLKDYSQTLRDLLLIRRIHGSLVPLAAPHPEPERQVT